MASIPAMLRRMAREGIAPDESGAAPEEAKHITTGVRFPSAKDKVVSPTFSLWSRGGDWSLAKVLKDGYNADEWVKVCVDRIAIPASTVPWRVSRFTGEDEKDRQKSRRRFVSETKALSGVEMCRATKAAGALEPEPGHVLETLLDEPNPYYDNQLLTESILQHLLLTGNGILSKVRLRKSPLNPKAKPFGPPLQLWPILPDDIKPVQDRENFIARYEAPAPRGQTEPIKISVHDVIHFKLPNPGDPTWGASPLKSAAMTVDADVEAIKWQKTSFENRAVPDGVLVLEGELNPEDFEEYRRQLAVQAQGPANARRIMVVGNAASYKQLSLSPVEMDFIKSRQMNRESICSVFGVHPRIAGISEGAGGDGTKKEIDRDHWVSTVIPILYKLQHVYNRYLSPEFGEDLYIWPDFSGVEALREIFHEQVRSAALLGRMGVPMKALNRRMELGFTEDEMEGLDWGLVPASTRSVKEILDQRNNPQLQGVPGGNDPNSETPDGGTPLDENPGGNKPQSEDPMDGDSNKGAKWAPEEVEGWLAENGIRSRSLAHEGSYITCGVENGDDKKFVLAAVARGSDPGVTLSGTVARPELRFYSPDETQ